MTPHFSVRLLDSDHWQVDYEVESGHGTSRKDTFKEALQFVLEKSADSEDLHLALITRNSSIYIGHVGGLT